MILPAALPTIFVGIRLASASAMLVLVASEMVGAKAGLGYLIINSQYSFLIPQMYFGILGDHRHRADVQRRPRGVGTRPDALEGIRAVT